MIENKSTAYTSESYNYVARQLRVAFRRARPRGGEQQRDERGDGDDQQFKHVAPPATNRP